MRPPLAEIEAFRLTCELGNFTRAAKAAGVTPQAVSRAVSRLEARLGLQLLRRSTRQIEVTEAGRRYHEACQAALATLDEAALALSGARDAPTGEVQVSVPTSYGHHRFLPLVGAFQRRHPGVTLDVEISNRNVDFIREGFDLAIRGGELDDASFVARRLGDFSVGVFASPDYLERQGTPTEPEDLDAHRCAVFVMPRTGRLLPWRFTKGAETIIPKAATRIRGDILGLTTFARTGAGLVQTFHYLVEEELAAGRLVEVLQSYGGWGRAFSLVYPKEAARRPEVRALVEFLVEEAVGPSPRHHPTRRAR